MAEKASIVLSAEDRTAAAFASAQKNLAKIESIAAAAGRSLIPFAAGFASAATAINAFNPKGVIDYADQLNKLTQRTGIATEQLSALDYAAKLSDVSTEELADSLKKLNQNIAAAARGEKEQAEAFRLIGVSVKDANGQIRSADKVLADIADRFSTYNDGANKVAIANAIGGRSFERLIPLLNGGSKGLADARDELQKFGGIIGGDLAKKSEAFNDNLTKIGVAANAAKVAIAGGLIDELGKLSDRLLEASKQGSLFKQALVELATFSPAGFTARKFSEQFGLGSADVDQAKVEAERLQNVIAGLEANLQRDPGNPALIRRLDNLRGKLKEAQTAAQALQTDKFLRGEKAGSDFSAAPVPKKDAPALTNNSAASDAQALLRRLLDGRLKALQDGLSREQDLFQNANQQLQALYEDGELSISQFYDRKQSAQLAFLVDQQKGFDAEVAALREFQRKADKASEKQDAQNRIDEVLARQAKAYLEAGQAAEQAERQRVRATEDFKRALQDLDAQLAESNGDQFAADAIRNAQRVADARKLLARGGESPERANQLQQALAATVEFSRIQNQVQRLNEAAQTQEEALLIAAQRSGATRADVEAQVYTVRSQALGQLDDLIRRTEELSNVSQDPTVLQYLEQLRLARERAFDQVDPGLVRFNELARSAGEAIAQSFGDAVVEGGKLSDVIRNIEKQIISLVTQDLITKPLADYFTKAIKDIAGSGTGGGAQTLISGLGNSLKSAIGSLFGFQFHEGGVVGEGGQPRAIPLAAMAGATRYHSGGIAGMRPDEVPAILRRGEEVLTAADPRHRDNMTGGGKAATITVNVQAQPGMSRQTALQQGRAIAEALSLAQRRNG